MLFVAGSEGLTDELRYRSCVDMVARRRDYVNHRLGPRFRRMSTFDESVADCTRSSEPSSIWTMAALSTVLQRPIISVYPWVNGQSDVYADVANVMLTPISERTGLSPLMIMWTRNAPNVGNVWLANHFVPLFRNSDRSASTSGEEKDRVADVSDIQTRSIFQLTRFCPKLQQEKREDRYQGHRGERRGEDR